MRPQATARKNRVARCLRARAIGPSPHRPKFPILKCPATPSMTPRAAPVGVPASTRPGQFVCGSVGAICMVRSGSQCYPSGRFCSTCSGLAEACALNRLREGLVRPKMKKEQRECLGDVWSEGGDDTEHRGVLGRPRGDMVLRMSILSWTHSLSFFLFFSLSCSSFIPMPLPDIR